MDQEDSDEAVLQEQTQSRAYALQVQKNVGTMGLLTSRWSDELGSPSAVAIEVMLVAALAAGACFLLAAYPPPGEE